MSELPNRHTIRWQGYDYARAGAYYLTICANNRLHLFGRIADGVVHPSHIGAWARWCWDAIHEHMPHVDVGEFVVMPNHVHGIVVIRERVSDARGAVGGGALDIGARHDAPDTTTNAPDTLVNTTEFLGGSNDPPHDPRARHDAPQRDPRKPPGIPRGALGQIVASYKSAVTRMAYRDGLLPVARPCGNGIIGTTSFGVMAHTNASRNTSATTPPIGGRTGSIGEHQGRRVVVESRTACGGRGCIRHGWYGV